MGTYESTGVKIAEQLVSLIGILLSTVFLSGVNIAISGHLLGYALGLSKGKVTDPTHFTLRIPGFLRVGVNGSNVFAGFAAYSLSLGVVGVFFTKTAHAIFITNLEATSSHWSACQALAAVLSVAACVLISSLKLIFTLVRVNRDAQGRLRNRPSDAERVNRIVGGSSTINDARDEYHED